MAKLYIGNLGNNFTDDQLAALFLESEKVASVVIVKSNQTFASLGCGIVELDDDCAQGVIDRLNGKDVGGAKLTVSIIKV